MAAPAVTALTRIGDVDGQVPAVEVVAVKSSDGGLALFLRRHLDEAEAARAARVAVFDDRRRLDRAGLREMLAEIFARSLVREITDVEFHGHVCVPLLYWSIKRSFANRSGFGGTAAAKDRVRVLRRSGFCGLKPACSRT